MNIPRRSTQTEEQLRIVASAKKRLEKLEMQDVFDPNTPGSAPTEAQNTVFKEFGKKGVQIVRAGNQSFLPTSQVLMADGSLKAIAKINEGDLVKVYDQSLKMYVDAPVLKLWNNGVHPVYRTWVSGRRYIDVTPCHEMVTLRQTGTIRKVKAQDSTELSVVDTDLGLDTLVPLDDEHKEAELLGFLLGDGCFTRLQKGDKFKGLQYSTKRSEHVDRVTFLLKPNYYLRDCKNGDYFIATKATQSNYYIDLIRGLDLAGKYAHQKSIPQYLMEARPSIKLALLNGLIATDGMLSYQRGAFYSSSEIFARQVLTILQSFGLVCSLTREEPRKDTHNPAFTVEVRSTRSVQWLNKNLTVSAKTGSTKPFKVQRNTKAALNVKIVDREFLGEFEVFDITVDHPDHNYVSDGFNVGNSGKSQIGARLVAWLLAENHPHWQRPKNWGKESLQFVVLGRNSKQIEESLYKRIKSYFPEGALKENRIGNIMQSVKHRETGNTIIFQSYENENQARERVQSFTSHFIWIDEMPTTLALITESLTRVQAKDGFFLATFTPLVLSQEVRKWCDTLHERAGATYRLKMFDNPIYTPERQEIILQKMQSLPPHVREARLYGEWIAADSAVYYWDEALMMENPRDYSLAWRHVESSDPAISSAHGLTVWAEDPNTGVWYLIVAEQLQGFKDNQGFLEEVLRRTKNMNIVRRIYDTAATSYAATAQRFGVHYTGVYHKAGRKIEMIQNFQASLGTKVRIASWCQAFVDQLTDCHWADNAEGRIVRSSKFHMLDSACYFVDCMPKGVIQERTYNPLTALREAAVLQRQASWKRQAEEAEHGSAMLRRGPLQIQRYIRRR